MSPAAKQAWHDPPNDLKKALIASTLPKPATHQSFQHDVHENIPTDILAPITDTPTPSIDPPDDALLAHLTKFQKPFAGDLHHMLSPNNAQKPRNPNINASSPTEAPKPTQPPELKIGNEIYCLSQHDYHLQCLQPLLPCPSLLG